MTIHREEARCSEETALRMKDKGSSIPLYSTFGAALGIPLVVSTDVVDGKVQFWQDGKMIKEVDVEL
jgi:hypothetical protein